MFNAVMTGLDGLAKLRTLKQKSFLTLQTLLSDLSKEFGNIRLQTTPRNETSLALDITNLGGISSLAGHERCRALTQLGSKLHYRRFVGSCLPRLSVFFRLSGCRVVVSVPVDEACASEHSQLFSGGRIAFHAYGSHIEPEKHSAYLTLAAAIGSVPEEMRHIVDLLRKTLRERECL